MNFYFHIDAEAELTAAVDYYEEHQPGLGIAFLHEVYATIRRISEYPMAWEKITPHIRRCLTRRFPYGIIYRIVDGNIQIVAVMNLHREPGYFSKR